LRGCLELLQRHGSKANAQMAKEMAAIEGQAGLVEVCGAGALHRKGYDGRPANLSKPQR
jgi:hypothetical protein